jgi:hypothetical protein
MQRVVAAVARSATPTFSKRNVATGVEGDAQLGKTVKHRSRVACDPSQPNLRQIHLLHASYSTSYEPLASK